MSASMNTILVIGGTSGIGEAFARRWHSQGKNVILTGRREQKLLELEHALPGARSHVMDNTDLPSLPDHVEAIFTKFPEIDTVWINSGAGSMFSFKDVDSTTDEKMAAEITLNVTAPTILTRHIVPKLLARQRATTIMITGSGMGFVPNGYFPVYAPSKAFTHSFLVGLRQVLKDTDVHVVEIVPPMVKTDMHDDYGHLIKNVQAMELEDFVAETFAQLDGSEIGELKEVAAGSAKARVGAWRESIGEILAQGMAA